jgi:predicted Zn-dependent protease
VTRNGSPLDGGSGPVRYIAFYRDKLVYVFACASRSSQNDLPADDRVFMSSVQTLRSLKPSEFPLAEPYRIRTIVADANTRMGNLAKNSPLTKFPEQTLRLINDLYPKKEPAPGDPVKIVE